MIDLPLAPDPGDPLAQPTRARLFALLGEIGAPASTGELAERTGLHPNGVRAHLERLEEEGLVARTREHRPRGRPRDAWTIAPGARPGGDAPHAYRDVSRWLARVTASPARGMRAVEEIGREIGREIAPKRPADARDAVPALFSALGFQPRVTADATTLGMELCNCPYRDAVRENPRVVCTLHRGLTQGVLDAIQPDARLTTFEPHDPDEAGCIVEIEFADRSRKG